MFSVSLGTDNVMRSRSGGRPGPHQFGRSSETQIFNSKLKSRQSSTLNFICDSADGDKVHSTISTIVPKCLSTIDMSVMAQHSAVAQVYL